MHDLLSNKSQFMGQLLADKSCILCSHSLIYRYCTTVLQIVKPALVAQSDVPPTGDLGHGFDPR